ncbi:ABC transporter permease [Roseovarius sp. 2305UL8-3]|uniref:ABC transporter permease n=1 Tax=Roseovarius conchicola TaxID=3121636 RepID=UPI0035290C89
MKGSSASIRHSGLRKFRALLAFYSTEFSNYRAEFVIYLIGGTQPLIMLFIWVTLNTSGALEGDYSSGHFICYFLLIYGVRNCNAMWFTWALDQEIREGDLSFKLLRPVHPYWNYLAYQLADSVIRVPLMMIFLVAGMIATGAYSELLVSHLPFALLALLGGMATHFYANFLMGTLSFWMERTLGIEMMYYTLMLLLGGAIIPIEFFPDTVEAVIRCTPFPYILGFPVDVAMGNLSAGEMLRGFILQVGWITGIGLLGRHLWIRGTKNYSGAGA